MLRSVDRWLLPYVTSLPRRIPADGTISVFIAVCDHFEPLHDTDLTGALDRLRTWLDRFPAITDRFCGADGVPPRHTCFFPVEQYEPRLLDEISKLCRSTKAEVEIHLHHRNDSAAGVEDKLQNGVQDLCRHGLLSREESGRARYGFIHGNWALNHCDPHGRGCGVHREIPILKQTGCFADFTMPSAPHATQARKVNSIYYSADATGANALHSGTNVAAGVTAKLRHSPNRLLLIQGPLALNWKRRKFSVLPKIENSDLTGRNPPDALRMQLWINQRIGVTGRPDWIFVKLHTHGGIPQNFNMLLGEPMLGFFQAIEKANRDPDHRFRYHFVSAREMVNLIHAAEDKQMEETDKLRNYLFPPPPVLQ